MDFAKDPAHLIELYKSGERRFRSLDLRGADLRGVDLRHSSMGSALLQGADLRNASLDHINFGAARLMDTKFDGASLRDAYLAEANLSHASLANADLQCASLKNAIATNALLNGANLSRTILSNVNLSEASLKDVRLEWALMDGATLCDADLSNGRLSHAELVGADLAGACLEAADLTFVDLTGACLQGTRGSPGERARCRLDFDAYRRSSWSANILAEWHLAGATVTDFETFPEDVRDTVLRDRRGLVLYFSTRLVPFDRFLIDAAIYGTLGRDSDCVVQEFRNNDDGTAVVRIHGSRPEDLEAVAEALYRRVWEQEQRVHQTAAIQVASLVPQAQIREGLTNVRNDLHRMELRAQRNQDPLIWRNDVLDALLRMTQPQLQEVRLRLGVPVSLMPGANASMVEHAVAIIDYMAAEDPQLANLEQSLKVAGYLPEAESESGGQYRLASPHTIG